MVCVLSQWEHGRNRSSGASAGKGPLYTVGQARAGLSQLRSVDYDVELAPARGVRARFRDAGGT